MTTAPRTSPRSRMLCPGCLALAGALALSCAGERPVAPSKGVATPTYSVDGLTGFSCDMDVTASLAIDSAGIRPTDAVTYTFHITGSVGAGSPTVTATVDRYPGAVLDLLATPGIVPVPFQSPGPGSPPPPDVSGLPVPTQATIDSLKLRPLDSFCGVARGTDGLTLAPAALGSQGSLVHAINYPSSVTDTLKSDAATRLLTEEVVTLAGQVIRDTKYVYSGTSAGAVYRANMTITESFLIEDQPVDVSLQVATRNVTRTLGGQ